MRSIPDDVLDLIAGGRSARGHNLMAFDTGTSMTTVTVTGHRDPEPDPPPPDHPGDWGDGGGTTGGNSDTGPHHRTPVPAHAPADVDMDALRNLVLDTANQLKAMAAKDGNEHGALIVRAADGSLKIGPISTGDPDKNTMEYQPQPGEKIVGWVHDHPFEVGIDERMPSHFDVNQYHDLTSKAGVDPNALMYIVDMESGDTFEYQNTSRFDRPGSDISKDM
jgi:hypothetical protein